MFTLKTAIKTRPSDLLGRAVGHRLPVVDIVGRREQDIQVEHAVICDERQVAAVLLHEVRYALDTEPVIILVVLSGARQSALVKVELADERIFYVDRYELAGAAYF